MVPLPGKAPWALGWKARSLQGQRQVSNIRKQFPWPPLLACFVLFCLQTLESTVLIGPYSNYSSHLCLGQLPLSTISLQICLQICWLWQVVLGPSPPLLRTQCIHLKIQLQWRGSLEAICLVQISGLPLTVTLTKLWHSHASDKVVMTATRRLLQGLAVIIVAQTALPCILVFLFCFVGRGELAAKTAHWLLLRLKASPSDLELAPYWTCATDGWT